MNSNSEELENLLNLSRIYKFNLYRYEEMAAGYGINCPPHVLYAIDENKQKLEDVNKQLASLNISGSSPDAEKTVFQNLPPCNIFVGREKDLDKIIQGVSSKIPLISIVGMGGIGKTAVAIEAAHLLINKGLFKGAIWNTAKEKSLELDYILNTIIKTVRMPQLLKLPAKEKEEEVQSVLRMEALLLLVDNIDNITDTELLEFLACVPEPSKVIITSRVQIENLDTIVIKLGGLPFKDSKSLIQQEIGRLGKDHTTDSNDTIIRRIHKVTGGSPLAIRWIVGQIYQYNQPYENILNKLEKASGNIFEVIFKDFWQSARVEEKRILLSFSFFVSPASTDALQAVSGVFGDNFDRSVAGLSTKCLVDSYISPDGYCKTRLNIHPLTRTFANALLLQDPEWEGDARQRWLDYFTMLVHQHGKIRNWSGFSVLDEEFPEIWNVASWHALIIEKGHQPTSHLYLTIAKNLTEIADNLSSYLWEYGHWTERIKLSQWAIEAANILGDHNAAIVRMNDIGWTLYNRSDNENSKKWLEKSLVYARRSGIPDKNLYMRTSSYLGLVYQDLREYEMAESIFKKLIEYWDGPSVKDPLGLRVTSYLDLGRLYLNQDKLDEAKIWLLKALELSKTVQNYNTSHKIVACLGDLALKEDAVDQAEEYYQTGLKEIDKIKQPSGSAMCIFGLAKVARKKGDLMKAIELSNRALTIYQELGMLKEIKLVQDFIE